MTVTWSKHDHAELTLECESTKAQYFKLQDWVLFTDRFKKEAHDIIEQTMLDHSQEYKNKHKMERERFIRGRAIKEYETELMLMDREEGITSAHVMHIIAQRVASKQKQIQRELVRGRARRLEEMQKELASLYRDIQ